jgi:hypothetical protein
MNSDQIPNILGWKTICLIPEIFVQRLEKYLLSITEFFNILTNSLLFSEQNLINLEPIERPLTVYLQINTEKYDTDREITNTYKNFQIV